MNKAGIFITAFLLSGLAACEPKYPLDNAITDVETAAIVEVQPKQARKFNDISQVPELIDGVRVWEGYKKNQPLYVARGLAQIEVQEPMEGGVLFIGDSITQAAPVAKLFPDTETRNHGVSADQTIGLFMRMSQVLRHKPKRVFIKMGTNDISNADREPEFIAYNIQTFVRALNASIPHSEIYLISILPRQAEWADQVVITNELIKEVALEQGVGYLDIYPHFDNGTGNLIPEITYDGLHLNAEGYQLFGNVLRDCVMNGCEQIAPPEPQ